MTPDKALLEAMAFAYEFAPTVFSLDERKKRWHELSEPQRGWRLSAMACALSAAEAHGWVMVSRARLERWAVEIYNDGTPAQAGPTAEEIRVMLATAIEKEPDSHDR